MLARSTGGLNDGWMHETAEALCETAGALCSDQTKNRYTMPGPQYHNERETAEALPSL